MTKWLIWNNTQNRVEIPAVFPSQTAADAQIARLRESGPPRTAQAPDSLVATQVGLTARNADTLELTGLGGATTQTVKVKRGTLEVAPGHLSYVVFDDEQAARTYVALHTLERWRYRDQSRA